jgi:peptide/nickel transport system substrate-binding protein
MRVAETLVDADRDGNPIPRLAENWNLSDDGLVWCFKLRQGVLFHDGTPLTAESVVKSLKVARSKPGLLDRAPIAAIEADGSDVVIRLSQPFAPLLAFLAEYRSLILASSALSEAGEATSMVATGPFRVSSIEPPQRLSVERFPRLLGVTRRMSSVPPIARPDGVRAVRLWPSGDADVAFTLDPASRTRLEKSDEVNVLSVAIPRSVLLKLNVAHDFLKEIEASFFLRVSIPGIMMRLRHLATMLRKRRRC